MNTLKERLIDNLFAFTLKNYGHIDVQQFNVLSLILQELAVEWKDQSLVDKETTADLFEKYVLIHDYLVDEISRQHENSEEDLVFLADQLITNCLR